LSSHQESSGYQRKAPFWAINHRGRLPPPLPASSRPPPNCWQCTRLALLEFLEAKVQFFAEEQIFRCCHRNIRTRFGAGRNC